MKKLLKNILIMLLLVINNQITSTLPEGEELAPIVFTRVASTDYKNINPAIIHENNRAITKPNTALVIQRQYNNTPISTNSSSLMEEYIPTGSEIAHDNFYDQAQESAVTQATSPVNQPKSAFSWFSSKAKKQTEQPSPKTGAIDLSSITATAKNEPQILLHENETALKDNVLHNSATLNFTEPLQPAAEQAEREISQKTYYSFSTAAHNKDGSLASLEYINYKTNNSPQLTIDYDTSTNPPSVKSATIIQNGKKSTLPFIFHPTINKYTATFVSNSLSSITIDFDPDSRTGQTKITENINAELPIETWFDSQGNVNRQGASNENGRSVRQYTKTGSTVTMYDAQGAHLSTSKYDLNGNIIPDNTNKNRTSGKNPINQKISNEILFNNNETQPTIQTNKPKLGKISPLEKKPALQNPLEYKDTELIKNITDTVAIDIQNKFPLEKPSQEQVIDITMQEIKSIPEYEALTPQEKVELDALWKTIPLEDLQETHAYQPDMNLSSFNSQLSTWIEKIMQMFLEFMKNLEQFRQDHVVSSRQKLENESVASEQQRREQFAKKIQSGILRSSKPRQGATVPQSGIDTKGWDFSNLSSRPVN